MFDEPSEVTDLDMAFGGKAMDLMPPYNQELRDWSRTQEAAPYLDFQSTWFALGLEPDTELYFNEGIDGNKALRHLKAIQGSFEPKHEHKMAGVAWLLHRWSSAPPKAVPLKKEVRR